MTTGTYSETLKHPAFCPFSGRSLAPSTTLSQDRRLLRRPESDNKRNGSYVELIAFLFILPSALFRLRGSSRRRFSKRDDLVAVKIFEIFSCSGHRRVSYRPYRVHARYRLSHGTPCRVLQPGEVRHLAGNDPGQGSLARQRALRDEHVHGDHSGHFRRRGDLRRLEI